MSRTTQTRKIGDYTFTVTQLPALRALKLSKRVGNVVAPALAKAVEALPKGGLRKAVSELDVDTSKLGGAIETLFATLSDAEFETITRELLETVHVELSRDGARHVVPLWPVVDEIMQGRTLDLFKVIGFAIEVNFADFFDAFRARKARQATAPSEGGA